MSDPADRAQPATTRPQTAAGEAEHESRRANQDRIAEIKEHATVLAEAYRLRLVGRLWWANLMFVVCPAVFATAAAILAAGPEGIDKDESTAWAAALAGLAAVLTAVHRAVKCEEYQTECLRLGPAYKAIAISADSPEASKNPDKLITEFADLTRSAKALLPDKYIRDADKRTGYKLYPKGAYAQPPWYKRLFSRRPRP